MSALPYNVRKQALLDCLKLRANHRYVLDGLLGSFTIPSVTQVIDPLLPYEAIPLEVRAEAMLRGTVVHKLTAAYDRGKYEKHAEEARAGGLDGYVQAWVAFKTTVEVSIQAIEQRVYHSKYRYAGTLDRLALVDGRPAVLEIKTGVLVPEHRLQTAAYLGAVNDGRTDDKVLDRYVVQLMKDGKFTLEKHKDKADWEAFKGALAIATWRMSLGH